MIDAIQVVTTAPTRPLADNIAKALVSRRLAACVQVAGPVRSTYRWQGQVESSDEWLCSIKTLRCHYPAVEATIRELHTYEVPEILMLEIAGGGADYLAWLAEATQAARPD